MVEVENAIIESLQKLDLNFEEAQIYFNLLKYGKSGTIVRKLIESYYTALIEAFWSKKRILEVYLNVIEFGNGIYGVEAASVYYFKKHAKYLTKYEAVSLASIIPSPLRYSLRRPSPYLLQRQRHISSRMEVNYKPKNL